MPGIWQSAPQYTFFPLLSLGLSPHSQNETPCSSSSGIPPYLECAIWTGQLCPWPSQGFLGSSRIEPRPRRPQQPLKSTPLSSSLTGLGLLSVPGLLSISHHSQGWLMGKTELTDPWGGQGVERGEGEAGGSLCERREEERPGEEIYRERGRGYQCSG